MTFVSRRGTYAFKRMPFGPKNAPAIFQALMNRTLGSMLYKTAMVYLDDVIVWGRTLPEVLERARQVIAKLRDNGLIMNGLKSEFGLRKVKLLGKTVANGTLYPGVDKAQGLRDLRGARTVKEVRSLYGLLSYYRAFVKGFSKLCKPITNLLAKEDGPVVWTQECEQTLKKIVDMIAESGLMLARYDRPFYIATDFSYEGIGAVLSQYVDGKEYPVMFASRTLVEAEQNYSPTEGEALGILFALRRF